MNALHISRLGLFIRRLVTINIHSFWIALGAIAGILVVITLLVAYFNPMELGSLQGLYEAVFYFGGFIFTSKIFSELHTPHRSYALLTLPVSNLEKLVGAWLITAPLFILVYMIFIFILTSLSSLIIGHYSTISHIFNQGLWTSISIYLVVHTIFFLGACTFMGNNFLKTLLSLFLLMVTVGIFVAIIAVVTFGSFSIHIENVSPEFQYFITDIYLKVINILFWYVLGPFMMAVSYFKLKEREV